MVIIAYNNGYAAAASTTGSVTYTVANGNKNYQFNSSGSITF